MKIPANYYGCAYSVDRKDPRHKIWSQERKERGFDSTELWNLDSTISRFILPRLKEFRRKIIGTPSLLSEEEWEKILDEMIIAFELIIREEPSYDWNEKETDQVNKGLDLFREYFFHLWQ
jgi:hypothetical protein